MNLILYVKAILHTNFNIWIWTHNFIYKFYI